VPDLLTNLPLSLSLFFNFDKAQLGTQLDVAITSKGLRQDISQLLVCVDVLHPYPTFLDALPDEVVLRVNVFAAIVKHMVFAQLYGRLVVELHLLP
jgi:hypothetical protein